MATLLRLTCLLLSLLLGGCSSLFFFPMKAWVQNPSRIGLGYEDVILLTPDGTRLHGWWLPSVGTPRGTLYFLHGNAQNVSTHIMSVNWLPDAGFNVFLLDYRGFGLSEGKARIPETLADIDLALQWLRGSGRVGEEPLILFGQSLGASMAVPVLAAEENRKRVQCAVLEAGFTGYRQIAGDVMERSWLFWPLRPLVLPFLPGDRFDAVNRIGEIEVPVMIMHSPDDATIPFAHGERLYDAATAPKEFVRLNGPHNAGVGHSDVRKRMMEFFEKACAARRPEPVSPPPAAPVPSGRGKPLQF